MPRRDHNSTTPMMTHLTIRVEGLVQGVGFRWAVRSRAVLMGVSGYVRNEDDGSVTIEAEAEAGVMESFLDWCRQGSDSARVERVLTEPGKVKGFSSFVISF